MPIYFQLFIVAILGLALGSFATVLIHRIPDSKSWKGAVRSRCPQCNAVLGVRDLIPVFSWLILGGKCRACKKPIGISYLLTELSVLIGCLGVYATLGLTISSLMIILCVPFLIALLVIDLRHMILPDQLVIIVAVLALFHGALSVFQTHTIALTDFTIQNLGGGVVYAAFAWAIGTALSRWLKKDALGFGDVKFFGAAGLWLGLTALGPFCLLSGILGVAHGLLWKLLKKGEIFPFGPSLIVSLYLLLIFETFLPL